MAQLAMSAVGAVGVGSLFGKANAGYGWLAGSLMGAWLFAPKTMTEGPRLDDLEVQISQYGTAIPIGFGTVRCAGNVIWSEGIKEHRNSQKVGGKGGPSVTQITYTYTCSFAVAYADREVSHHLKTFADGKCIYDIENDGSTPTNHEASRDIKFTLYKGTETQTVDPVMESVEGTGSVSAYRGVCYEVYEDLLLTDYGNRIPQLSAILTFAGSDKFPAEQILLDTTSYYPIDDCTMIDSQRPFLFTQGLNSPQIARINTITSAIEAQGTMEWNIQNSIGAVDEDGYLWLQMAVGGSMNCQSWYKVDPHTFEMLGYPAGKPHYTLGGFNRIPSLAKLHLFEYPMGGQTDEPDKLAYSVSYLLGYTVTIFHREITFYDSITEQYYLQWLGQAWIGYYPRDSQVDRNNNLWIIGTKSGVPGIRSITPQLKYADSTSFAQGITKDFDMLETVEFDLSGVIDYPGYMYYDSSRHTLLVFTRAHTLETSGNVGVVYDIESNSITYTQSTLSMTPAYCKHNFQNESKNDTILLSNGSEGHILSVQDLSILSTYDWSDWDWGLGSWRGYTYDPTTRSVFVGLNRGIPNDNKFYRLYLDRAAGAGESLQSVVEYLDTRANLTNSTDDDASALSTITVAGYLCGRQMSVANSIRPLADAYLFRAVESDWKIKFNLINVSNSFVVTEDELATVSGSTKNIGKSMRSLVQELELPLQVVVNFKDSSRDHEINAAESISRNPSATITRNILTIDVPVLMTYSQAKQLAEKWLYILWTERLGLSTSLSYKHLRIDAGDTGTITEESVTYTVRAGNPKLGSNLVLDLEFLQLDSQTFSSNASGNGGSFTEQSVATPGPCEMFVFDIPCLRDYDISNGRGPVLYTGVTAFEDNWRGSNLFFSTDKVEYFDINWINDDLDWGVTHSALSNLTRWETWDRYGYVDVLVKNGTLASDAEVDVLNGSNAALVENQSLGTWELIQYATVVDLGSNVYRLSNLLRGRRGTDNWISGHAIGERVVFLSTSTLKKYVASNDWISDLIWYKAMTTGAPPIQQLVKNFELTGNAYKPYSPTYLKGSRDESDNLTITWYRRTRIGGEWKDATGDVPLGEDTESYEIDILDAVGGTVLRTISATSETASYSASEQTDDGLTPGDDVYLNIYQISSYVGRGFKTEATV